MSFGKCRQKIAPDSPSLRVRTPSKSHAALTLHRWPEKLLIFEDYRLHHTKEPAGQ